MDLGIQGKTALVFGADSGIGWNTARILLAEGATVVVSDLDQAQLDNSADQLEAPLGKLHAFAADVTSAASLADLHGKVRDAVGAIDILVQSSGVTGAQGLFHEIDEQGWADTIDVDLMGPVRITREFIGDLRQGGWGRIVYLVSEDASQPYDDELPYCAAKAGVLSFAKGLSRTYAQEGVLVNTVSPAFIHTPMTDAMMNKRAKETNQSFDDAITSFLDEERPYMELKRRGEPEEVANVIAFLCSDLASFVNGSNYRVDSGSVATI
ncbi:MULTISPECIES: SDR family oxidoreductase [unclassified Curtobacterium]|uniref:SDR family NAD(P)-dependent oxidoreductase n=1 Tax=unclassified Curtobacterium TaxID=257496 RepID=UPI000DA81C4C|nr:MULTISPECIES: SDR family oxidoreductase [unclassified Curtobacterium]ROS36045.1 NAD(P)-dependent dehydrogenase (short-subunit alcohol dehydrogenase family) [Curtobacterium sp. PhB78]RPE85021.1 NAD(P)-dependent dehydrogenase (short-subunit alcohol dehydrogenase family) [Curtobacterium sp. PhB137]TCL76598.1 NAD(P)-dependent dehydrogenase (short-subunit alcohol dehydrogenase family) [Curtobacterium sp. PhB128]TCL91461.1 NAD(P)-dependent dehydrogenase (short-subunit alcohol dehydrogenase family)